jgi:type III secretion protein U
VSDKTEDPTPKRLRRAREEGDSGASAYGAQAIAFVAAVAAAPSAAHALASWSGDALRAAIRSAAHPAAGARFDPLELATSVVALTAPLLAAAGIAGGVAFVVQTGGVVASKRLTPKLDRLNPAAGLRSLFSGARLFAVARALVAGVVVGWLGYAGLQEHAVDFARLAGRTAFAGGVVASVAGALAWRAALVGLALGVADVLVTRRAWLGRLKMSKDEVKREYRESEGDPQIKQARERAYQEMLAQAAIANVRTASVVVVNPTHLACALRYATDATDATGEGGEGGEGSERDEAPVVVASGQGDMAARIVQAAHDYGVPVVRDVPLARALVELEVGDVIPEALYEAVAEILREAWEQERQQEEPKGG